MAADDAMEEEDDEQQHDADLTEFAIAASVFSDTPGPPSDASVDEFLKKYPLGFIFSALERYSEMPGLESSACAVLDRVFKSSLGAAMLPSVMPFAAAGLSSPSATVRRLACSQILNLIEHADVDAEVDDGWNGLRAIIVETHLPELLVQSLSDNDTGVAHTAIEALKNLAKLPSGLQLVISGDGDVGGGGGGWQGGTQRLKDMALHGSCTVRIRVMALAAAVSSVSVKAAEAVRQLGLLDAMVKEVDSNDDVLAQVNALELLAELASTANGANFIIAGSISGRLASLITSQETDPLVRVRALVVAGRLLSPTATRAVPTSESQSALIIRAIDTWLESMNCRRKSGEHVDVTVEEAALDALGQIGSSKHGAEILLTQPDVVARHVVRSTWRTYTGGCQLAAVHALASILGAERGGGAASSVVLNESAEACLADLVYTSAAESSSQSPTPGDAILSLLRQSREMRIAVYRLLIGMVARPWGISELCANGKLLGEIVDPYAETTKGAMDWRYSCVVAASTAAAAAARKGIASISSDCIEKLEAAARRGPYLTREAMEAIPIVTTDERPAPAN